MEGCREIIGLRIHNRDGIVVKYCWDVFRRELVCCVADEKACLSDGTVANDHAPGRGEKVSVTNSIL